LLQVVVFSKSYCPFCVQTKELFEGLDIEIKVHELDEMGEDGPALQHALLQMSGQKSVPNIFIKGTHIGGNSDIQAAAKDGKLKEMLGI
jgi:glutaredoxin